MIRSIVKEDFEQLRSIYDRYYKDDFPFPDFLKHYLAAFIITDEDEQIVTAGGIRVIAEVVAITDKSLSLRKRVRALKEFNVASQFIAASNGFNNLNAFVKGSDWKSQLKRVGFKSEEVLQLEL